jgi:hypothetical protein
MDARNIVKNSKYAHTFIHKYFQTFIRAVEGIQEALQVCERSVAKLGSSGKDMGSGASTISEICVEFIRVIGLAVASVSTEEMRSMKSGFKNKVGLLDEEVKKQFKEISSLKQSMEKAEGTFERTDSEMKKAHSRTTDPFLKKSTFSWLSGLNDRDKQFERMQELAAEQGKITAEYQSIIKQIVAQHTAVCSRANVASAELASMRRRLNRKVIHESNQFVSRIQAGFDSVSKSSVPTLLNQLTMNNPTLGDFGLKLPDSETSLRFVLGSEKEDKIRAIQAGPDRIEYRAVQSYLAKEAGELSFSRNEVIQVIKKDSSGWWHGRNSSGETGVFPSVLLAERPAGAILPLHQTSPNTLRPNLNQSYSGGTWHSSANTLGNAREQLVMCQAPYSLVGVVQFRYIGESISVEPGEVVKIGGITDMTGFVQIRKENGREGPVPLKILGIKDENDHSKLSCESQNINDWSYSLNW